MTKKVTCTGSEVSATSGMTPTKSPQTDSRNSRASIKSACNAEESLSKHKNYHLSYISSSTARFQPYQLTTDRIAAKS